MADERVVVDKPYREAAFLWAVWFMAFVGALGAVVALVMSLWVPWPGRLVPIVIALALVGLTVLSVAVAKRKPNTWVFDERGFEDCDPLTDRCTLIAWDEVRRVRIEPADKERPLLRFEHERGSHDISVAMAVPSALDVLAHQIERHLSPDRVEPGVPSVLRDAR